LRLEMFLLHSNKKSHLIVILLLHLFFILDTFFLVQRCMVPWTYWFILACSCLCGLFGLVEGFPPFSLGSQILWMSLKWQHNAISCFYGPKVHKEHSHSLPTLSPFF
jgi:hypothetical protein